MRQRAGKCCQRRQDGRGYRWGREQGFVVVDGQKVEIQRPRVGSVDSHEETLGSYELFRCDKPLDEAVWDKLMLRLSTRNYCKAVRQFAAAYGIEQSAVSEHFIRVSRRKVREVLERDLSKFVFCAIYIDGIEFKGLQMIVALRVNHDGAKTVLGCVKAQVKMQWLSRRCSAIWPNGESTSPNGGYTFSTAPRPWSKPSASMSVAKR